MKNNKQLLDKFYNGFREYDYVKMQQCYHEDVKFSDPLFNLKGNKARAMWHMIMNTPAEPEDYRSFTIQNVTNTTGIVDWEAKYSFKHKSKSRRVHNKSRATFKFKDGKIIRHRDDFDLYRWSKMALGFTAFVFGKVSFFQNKVRETANGKLDKFLEIHPEYK